MEAWTIVRSSDEVQDDDNESAWNLCLEIGADLVCLPHCFQAANKVRRWARSVDANVEQTVKVVKEKLEDLRGAQSPLLYPTTQPKTFEWRPTQQDDYSVGTELIQFRSKSASHEECMIRFTQPELRDMIWGKYRELKSARGAEDALLQARLCKELHGYLREIEVGTVKSGEYGTAMRDLLGVLLDCAATFEYEHAIEYEVLGAIHQVLDIYREMKVKHKVSPSWLDFSARRGTYFELQKKLQVAIDTKVSPYAARCWFLILREEWVRLGAAKSMQRARALERLKRVKRAIPLAVQQVFKISGWNCCCIEESSDALTGFSEGTTLTSLIASPLQVWPRCAWYDWLRVFQGALGTAGCALDSVDADNLNSGHLAQEVLQKCTALWTAVITLFPDWPTRESMGKSEPYCKAFVFAGMQTLEQFAAPLFNDQRKVLPVVEMLQAAGCCLVHDVDIFDSSKCLLHEIRAMNEHHPQNQIRSRAAQAIRELDSRAQEYLHVVNEQETDDRQQLLGTIPSTSFERQAKQGHGSKNILEELEALVENIKREPSAHDQQQLRIAEKFRALTHFFEASRQHLQLSRQDEGAIRRTEWQLGELSGRANGCYEELQTALTAVGGRLTLDVSIAIAAFDDGVRISLEDSVAFRKGKDTGMHEHQLEQANPSGFWLPDQVQQMPQHEQSENLYTLGQESSSNIYGEGPSSDVFGERSHSRDVYGEDFASLDYRGSTFSQRSVHGKELSAFRRRDSFSCTDDFGEESFLRQRSDFSRGSGATQRPQEPLMGDSSAMNADFGLGVQFVQGEQSCRATTMDQQPAPFRGDASSPSDNESCQDMSLVRGDDSVQLDSLGQDASLAQRDDSSQVDAFFGQGLSFLRSDLGYCP